MNQLYRLSLKHFLGVPSTIKGSLEGVKVIVHLYAIWSNIFELSYLRCDFQHDEKCCEAALTNIKIPEARNL